MPDKQKRYRNIEDNDLVVPKLKESLDFLDSNIEVKKPDFMKLVQIVNEVEEKKKARNNWQFLIFLVSALLLAAIETYSFSRSTVFFIGIQAAAVICIVPALVILQIRKNRQVSN